MPDKRKKLTDAQVEQIRRLWAKGIYTPVIARRFGIHKGQVSRIVNGKSRTADPFMKGVFQRILNNSE